jgi:hypothetical protein
MGSNLKGSAFLAELEYLFHQYGADGLERVKAALSPQDLQALFGTRVLSSTWVDYNAAIRFILTADRVLGKGDLQVVRDAGRYCAQHNFSGIYKFFISLTSPRFILDNAHHVWRLYHDAGNVTIEWCGEKNATLFIRDFPDMPLHHEWDTIPTLEETIRMSGGKNVVILHPQCLARGDEYCLADVSWE